MQPEYHYCVHNSPTERSSEPLESGSQPQALFPWNKLYKRSSSYALTQRVVSYIHVFHLF
jgi:hypothetical protein